VPGAVNDPPVGGGTKNKDDQTIGGSTGKGGIAPRETSLTKKNGSSIFKRGNRIG